jgi:hypothetical protein
MKTKNLLFGAILSLLFFISCDTNETVEDPTAITNEELIVNSNFDAATDDVSLIAEDQFSVQEATTGKTTAGYKSILPSCAVITTVLTNDSFTRTIDFGAQGCALPNGNIVSGKIIIKFSKNFSTPSRMISYHFDNFHHNGRKIEGTSTITLTKSEPTTTSPSHPVITHTVKLTITFADGKTYTRTGIRVKEMVEGFNTKDIWEDNVFTITGEHSTTFKNEKTITSKITKPLRFVMSCKMPFAVSGTIVFTKNDKQATLDFGNGECDALATITVGDKTKEITLKK